MTAPGIGGRCGWRGALGCLVNARSPRMRPPPDGGSCLQPAPDAPGTGSPGTPRCGMSDREIAAKLNISTSTVKAHLSSIYPKLGVSNRTQAGLLGSGISPMLRLSANQHRWRKLRRSSTEPFFPRMTTSCGPSPNCAIENARAAASDFPPWTSMSSPSTRTTQRRPTRVTRISSCPASLSSSRRSTNCSSVAER